MAVNVKTFQEGFLRLIPLILLFYICISEFHTQFYYWSIFSFNLQFIIIYYWVFFVLETGGLGHQLVFVFANTQKGTWYFSGKFCVGYFGEYISKDLVLEKRLEIEKKKQEDFNDIIEEDKKKPKNKIVYLDIVIKDFMTDDRTVRVFIELFFDKVPKTARNFYELCKKNKYAGVPFHRIISGFMIQGGDITNYDGTGGKSIYGKEFNDKLYCGIYCYFLLYDVFVWFKKISIVINIT